MLGQQAKYKTSIFSDCKEAAMPRACSEQKIKDGVILLVDNTIIDLVAQKGKDYFSISYFFVVDKDGLVIKELTEVRSEVEQLQAKISAYINSLPAFLKKDAAIIEQRSVFVQNLTFIIDPTKNNFRYAEPQEVRERKTADNFINFDSGPQYDESCVTNETYEQDIVCTQTKILQYIKKHYKVPASNAKTFVRMTADLLINTDGEVSVEKIWGSAPDIYEKEFARVIKNLPKIQSAIIKGIPAEARTVVSFSIQK